MTMNEETFNFWQDHSDNFIEMALRTDRDERPADADGHGIYASDCGDTVEIFLAVRQSRIEAVSLYINGCINTRACAYTVAGLIEGRTVRQAWEVGAEEIIDYLQSLPEAARHCAEIAIGALHRALADHRTISLDPWKKKYLKR